MISPYDVLGIPWDADEDTIRAAFRKAAKAFHPDLNAGDEAAEQRFKEITAARDAILKDRELWAMVDRHLAFDDPAEEPDDDRADRPAPRRWSLATAGGIAGAVLVACLISSAVVLISPRAASTEAGLATVIDAGASAIERGVPIAFTAGVAAANRDGGVAEIQTAALSVPVTAQSGPTEDSAAVESASDPDAPPPREDDGRWWTFLSDYSTGTWPEPVELPRARPGKQSAMGKHRGKPAKTGHPSTSATARKPGGHPAAPRPLRLSDVAEQVAYPPPMWRRPAYSRIGCWTDEGNRWLPCGP